MNPRKRIARCTIVALLVSMSLIVVTNARAQSSPTVREGDRIRVRYTPGPGAPETSRALVVGQFVHTGGDSLTVLTENGRRAIPAASITQIDRSAGTKTHTLEGALIGGGLMTALALAVGNRTDPDDDIVHDEELERATQVLLIALGTLTGAFIGHLSGTEQWEPTTVPGLTVGVTRDVETGAGIAVSFSF